MNQCPNQRRPSYFGFQTESRKVARHLIPERSTLRSGFNLTQIIKPYQYPMGTPKPTDNHCQPAGYQVRGDETVRIHLNRSPVETPLPHLPVLNTQKQGPDNGTNRVLKVGNQLDRQQRKGSAASSAQKTGNRNPILLETRKQLNGIAPVRQNLPITVKIATDRTHRSNNGEKINLSGKK